MGDYSNMASYYDVIMTSGYYDYAKIVDSLVLQDSIEKVLEIGCGTGLILEELARRKPSIQISGIDLTAPMLAIAKERLEPFKNVALSQQDVCNLSLPSTHNVAFSYGGVWYFVIDGDKEPFLVSHISDHEANLQGFEKMAQHIAPNGTLLLGIQGPHHDYETVISNGMKYSQKIDKYYLENKIFVILFVNFLSSNKVRKIRGQNQECKEHYEYNFEFLSICIILIKKV